VILQGAHRLAALHLDHLGDVDAGGGGREGDLDGQLVAGRGGAHRGDEPLADLLSAALGDPVDDPALGVLLAAQHQPVALEPVEGGVDLPDVERPGPIGAPVELGLEFVAVPWLLVQHGQNRELDGHLSLRVWRPGRRPVHR
jgi:hypothetical protein